MSVQATAGACNAVNILVQISQLPIPGELLVQMVIGKAEERVVGIQEQVKVDYGARFAIPDSEGPEPEERGCTTTSTEKIKVRYCVNNKFPVYLLTIIYFLYSQNTNFISLWQLMWRNRRSSHNVTHSHKVIDPPRGVYFTE